MTRSWMVLAALVIVSAPAEMRPQAPSDWNRLEALAVGRHARVTTRAGGELSGSIIRVDSTSLWLALDGGSRELTKSEITRVRVLSATRQVLRLVGIPAGLVIGFFVCPQCANEGNSGLTKKAMALGAAAGSVMLLIDPYSTIYAGP